jgi:hypothetical protein
MVSYVCAEASIMPEIGGSRAVLGGKSSGDYEREASAREMEAFEKLLTKVYGWV